MPEKRRKTKKEIKDVERVERAMFPAGEAVNRDIKAKLPARLTLQGLTAGIALATLNAKIIIDAEAVKARRSVYEGDDIMKNLPLMTFDISEVEIELKFAVEGVEGRDVVVSTEAEKLEKIGESLSTVRLRLKSKPIVEYMLPDGEKVMRD